MLHLDSFNVAIFVWAHSFFITESLHYFGNANHVNVHVV